MVDANGGVSWWHQTSRLAPPSPIEGLPRSVDVAIVGAGMMGASLAWWLTERGLRPLVLERGSPASAASGQNGGLVVVGASDEYVELAAQLGSQAAEELVRGTIENHALMQAFLEREGAGEAWTPAGFVDLWASEAYRQASVDSAEAMNLLGWETHLLDREGCEQAMGTRLGSRILGGAWTPHDSLAQPVTYVYALARAAHRGGARFAYETQVGSLTPTEAGWRLGAGDDEVEAEHVILAANVGTAALLPASGPLFRYVRDTVAVTAPVPQPILAGWNEDGVTPYGGPIEGGRMLFGGFASQRFGRSRRARVRAARFRAGGSAAGAPDSGAGAWDPGRAPWDLESASGEASLQERLGSYLAHTFPDHQHVSLAHVWSGMLGISQDRLPVVGRWPSEERLWLLTGFGGQGLPYSQWAPKLLAEAIAESAPSRIPWYLAPARFFDRP